MFILLAPVTKHYSILFYSCVFTQLNKLQQPSNRINLNCSNLRYQQIFIWHEFIGIFYPMKDASSFTHSKRIYLLLIIDRHWMWIQTLRTWFIYRRCYLRFGIACLDWLNALFQYLWHNSYRKYNRVITKYTLAETKPSNIMTRGCNLYPPEIRSSDLKFKVYFPSTLCTVIKEYISPKSFLLFVG